MNKCDIHGERYASHGRCALCDQNEDLEGNQKSKGKQGKEVKTEEGKRALLERLRETRKERSLAREKENVIPKLTPNCGAEEVGNSFGKYCC